MHFLNILIMRSVVCSPVLVRYSPIEKTVIIINNAERPPPPTQKETLKDNLGASVIRHNDNWHVFYVALSSSGQAARA